MWFYILMVLLFLFLPITILYFIAIMPKMLHRHDMTPWEGRYYAHRGLHQSKKKTPENSMAAFKLAVKHNYGIELDVQLTKDKVPVIIHDYSVKRVCGIDKKVNEFTLEELQQLNLYTSEEHIPTFESVLNMINGQVPVIIEYKVENHDTAVCDIVAPMLDNYKGVYCIESFNPLVLLWYKKHRPKVMRGQLSSNLLKDKEEGDKRLYFILSNLLLNFATKPDFIAYNHIHTDVLSFLICKRLYRIPTFAWTIQSQEALEESKPFFDYMIFDKFIPEE